MIVKNRNKHIKTRNLIVTETFDEFAKAVEALDFTVEDIVGYVTSVTRNFYWLNTENVWGVLGFTWDHLEDVSNEEALTHPNPLYRLTQVTSEGNKIEMDQQWLLDHRVQKGYGHFNVTTMPFTVIPVLPDGYRITEFNNTFNDIASDYIEVLKSDWSNLTRIHNLVPRTKSIKIDITGANLSNTNDNAIILSNNLRGIQNTWKSTVYIKGDLGNCTVGTFEGYNRSDSNWTAGHTIYLDDDNKELNLPISLRIQNQFYYTNPNKVFDIREWLSAENLTPVANTEIRLLAESGKYYFNNAFAKQIQDAGGIFAISPVASNMTATGKESFKNGIFIMRNPIAMNVTPCTVTIDCTEDGDVREDKLFIPRGSTSYGVDGSGIGSTIYEHMMLCFNPIVYQGTVNTITMWNPFCLVKDDDSWPVYDQSMVDKLRPISGYGIDQGYFMRNSYIYITKPSPYTIDCTNLTHLSLFDKTRFFVSDFSKLEKYGNTYCMEVVQLVNADKGNLFSFGIGNNIGDTLGYTTPFYFKINNNIKTVFFCNDRAPRIIIGKDTKIELAYARLSWYGSVKVEDITHPAFKFRKIDCRDYGMDFTIRNGFGYNEIAEAVTDSSPASSGPINLYEFEPEILEDIEFLKASNIFTFYNTSREVAHPLIATNSRGYNGGTITYSNGTNINISTDFVFIYRQNINMDGYNKKADVSNIVNTFVNKILQPNNPNRGIIANDTTSTYTIKLSKNIFDSLTSEQKSYIINDLNYVLTWTSK